MIPVDDAMRMWLEALTPLESQEIALLEAAGRVAAEEIRYPEDLPPFTNSAMDGYAFRHADAGGPLRIVGEVRAGQVRGARVEAGHAVRIMTGSAVPPGADTVVPKEDVEESNGEIRIRKMPAKAGGHIRPAGDDARAGSILLSPGEVIGPGHLASLASSGILGLHAYRRPRVAILTTGDEVVAPEATPPPGKIRDCNLTLQKVILERRGVALSSVTHVPDDPGQIRSWLEFVVDPNREPADLVVTTGGVSVGRYDFVRPLLLETGFQQIFWRVRMRPGKPIVTARRDGPPPAYACGLPGNPVSAFVGTLLYVIPAIDKLEGRSEPTLPWVMARLTRPVTSGPRTFFMTARLEAKGSSLEAHPCPRQGSHRVSILHDANALIRVEAGSSLDEGEEVPALSCCALIG